MTNPQDLADMDGVMRHHETETPVLLSPAVFWIAACILLFHNLGLDHLRGSEERWAEITREMLLTGDLFHPAINGHIYFDKPLLSYWPTVALAGLTGVLDEVAVRLPNAASALVALWCTRRLGLLLLSRKAAVLAGWLALTGFGFIAVARTASADMMNLAAVAAAVWWFFHCKDRAGFRHYLVFYLICFLGALTKGLPALVIPPLLVFVHTLLEGTWKKHLRPAHVLAALAGFALFLVPFEIAAHTAVPPGFTATEQGLTGLQLVWRENIVRVFDPFDHVEPFYSYLEHLPRILAPWPLLFFAAPAAMASKWKTLSVNVRWLVLANLIIFLMFSFSGSRRWYYIMPIVPFAALMMAEYVTGRTPYAWREELRKIHLWLLTLLSTALVLAAPVAALAGYIIPNWAVDFTGLTGTLFGVPAVAAAALALLFTGKKWPPRLWERLSLPGGWGPAVLSGFLILAVGMTTALPEIGALRTEKEFGVDLAATLHKDLDAEVAFYQDINPRLSFYMDLPVPTPVLKGPEELERHLSRSERPILLIADHGSDAARELDGLLPGFDFEKPFFIEANRPFQRPNRERITAWLVPID